MVSTRLAEPDTKPWIKVQLEGLEEPDRSTQAFKLLVTGLYGTLQRYNSGEIKDLDSSFDSVIDIYKSEISLLVLWNTWGWMKSQNKLEAPEERARLDLGDNPIVVGDDKKSAFQKALEAVEDDINPFLDTNGQAFAQIEIGTHVEYWPLRSRAFKNYVLVGVLSKTGKPISENTLKLLTSYFGAVALRQGIRRKVHLRACFEDGALYIDLCNKDWQVIAINKDRIAITDQAPVIFRRFGHMQELKVDLNAEKADLESIFEFVPVKDEDKLLYKVNICSNFLDISRPISLFSGPQGSGKSTALKMERRLVDPSSILTISLGNEDQLAQNFAHHFFPVFDNIRLLRKDQSDFICRAVTGDGFSKRELYTDEEDIIFNFKRKVGLNGINFASEEPDFLDRTISFSVERIKKDKRQTEEKLWKRFNVEQPKITGAILKILSEAFKKKSEVSIKELPRMADFAVWGEAIARSIGAENHLFLNHYWKKIQYINKEALEAHTIGLAIQHFLKDKKEWSGSASELLEELNTVAGTLKISTHGKDWPKSPSWLSRRINEVRSVLEDEGIIFEVDRKNSRVLKFAVIAVMPTQSQDGEEGITDGNLDGINNTDNFTDATLDGTDSKKSLLTQMPSVRQIAKNTVSDGMTAKSPSKEIKEKIGRDPRIALLDMLAPKPDDQFTKEEWLEIASAEGTMFDTKGAELILTALIRDGYIIEVKPLLYKRQQLVEVIS